MHIPLFSVYASVPSPPPPAHAGDLGHSDSNTDTHTSAGSGFAHFAQIHDLVICCVLYLNNLDTETYGKGPVPCCILFAYH